MIKGEEETHHEKMASNTSDCFGSGGSADYQFLHL
jgi:hypothetical protein